MSRHWVQTYTQIGLGGLWSTAWQCAGCGALVIDTTAHDEFHRLTRAIVRKET